MSGLLADLRYASRTLAKSPGFTVAAVLTLALGIGANTAIFSMVNALLLHPYNFPDLDRLVHVWESRGIEEGFDARWISLPDARDFRLGPQVFEDLATYRCQDFNSTGDENAQTIRGCNISANFFGVLGIQPAVGRSFTETEEQPGNDQVAIVSYGFWQQRFGRNSASLGKTIQLNGRSYTIVGVMPKSFDYPVPMEIWVPLALSTAEKEDRAQLSFQALGRLKPGLTVAQANAALEAVSRRMQLTYPQTNSNRTATLLQLRKELYLFTVPLFGLLQVAAGLVLMLAGANLANLFFARMIARRKEVALRTALGASRGRMARLFLTEALLLAFAAGALAIAVSFWSVNLLRTSISPSWTMWVPGWDGIQVDRTVLAFAFLLSIFVGVVFGLATTLRAGQTDSYRTLKEATAGSPGGARGRLRHALIVAQVMFALVLLICAAQTAQAFLRLAKVYQGFQPANVLRFEVSLPEKPYADATSVLAFYQRALRESMALPGVASASLALNSPASNIDNEVTLLTVEKRRALNANERPVADLQVSSPEYFQTLRIPLIAGRIYSDSDTVHTSPVAVVSRSLAYQYWSTGNALGQRIKFGSADASEPWTTVVGIVADVRQNWWNPTPRPTVYLPFAQKPKNAMVFLLRASSEPTSYAPRVREIVRQIDPGVAITEVNTLENEITDSIAIVRILGVLMSLFGGLALALASFGVFGTLAEAVARRTPEIGIRVALGAGRSDILKLVLGQAAKLCALGLAIGLPLGMVATQIMSTQIFGIARINLGLFAVLCVILLLTTLAAGYVPARRALRVDPVVALRYE